MSLAGEGVVAIWNGIRPEGRAEDPRDEVAPVIQVEVGDGDRIDARPAVGCPQPRQHARSAVEQEPAVPLHQVAGLRAARIGPRRGTADDDQFHGHIQAEFLRRRFGV